MSKLLWFVWLALLQSAFGFAIPNEMACSPPHATKIICFCATAYDEQSLAKNVYDVGVLAGSGYDSTTVPIANDKENRTVGASNLFARFAKFLAAENTTALSTYRMTTEGETFFHYGYAENAASFEGGLRPGGFATSAGDLSGAEAQSGLALPRATSPNAVYTVTPQPGTWVRVNPVTTPQFGQPGGLPEFQFPGGTGPGTVSPPMPILPR